MLLLNGLVSNDRVAKGNVLIVLSGWMNTDNFAKITGAGTRVMASACHLNIARPVRGLNVLFQRKLGGKPD